jgi:hypothetical protein
VAALAPISAVRATAVAAAVVVLALLVFIPPSTNDFWLHAAIGRMIWTDGEIPRTALFPFTEAAAFPFHAHEWLASVALYWFDRVLGEHLLILANGLLGLALFALLWRLSFRLSGGFVASLLLAVAVMATANYRHYLRPELFALILALGVLGLLVEYRSSRKWRYLLACMPLAVLWANSHGSFPVALVLAAAFAAGAAWEARAPRASAPYLACGALMALAMLANPYGAQLFRFAWEVQGAEFLRTYVYEWTPTLTGPFVGSRGFWAFVAFACLAATVLAYGWRRVPLSGALLLVIFGGLALQTQRHIAFFAVVSVYPLSAALAPTAARLDRSARALGAAAALLACGVALLVRYGNLYGGYPYAVASNHFSPGLIDYVRERKLEGNVLNSYALGAEIVYRFYPSLRPSIDSRIDVYGREYFERMLTVQNEEQAFRQFVARYGVRYVLLLWPEFELGLRRMPGLQAEGWRIVFVDHKMVMLERSKPAP